ncbi:DUF2164 domain-containing protein [Stappia taiwanensis]|uniref:DUF2164 domain-containing protein n=1 Tax=Stappia taiwanensis TaxID=992267 RepID=A0A838XK67_9HYPH|nr:DUF2164 domain-containing protein [Stappia taiwanensis]MBA4610502.1 DUF2164 domain-containing protein [Stappia taiwanensis]GGE84396.1 hypothetical protein GCM10007285_10020 [Stappia taiwanensis]
MAKIEFSKEERAALARRIRDHLRDEFDMEIGALDADIFLRFLSEEIGGAFYNRGLLDAQAAISARFDEIAEVVYALEQPTTLGTKR